MSGEHHPEWVIDPETPSVARMHDYYLGGKDNFAADRKAADQVVAAMPNVLELTRANRRLLSRAVTMMANRGVRQFIDIGSGLPTRENVHEVAQRAAPDARVVYVDNDPIVLVHARALLADNPLTAVVQADLREPESILEHPEVRARIDFARPVGLLLLAILHFVPDDDRPAEIVAKLRGPLVPGSFLAISHGHRGEVGRGVENQVRSAYGRTGAGDIIPRGIDEVTKLFEGTELIGPGVVQVADWRADAEPFEATCPDPAARRGGRSGVMLPPEFLFSRAFSEDPYAAYDEMRASGPVHPIDFPPGTTAFLVVDHEHGRAALNDPRLSKDSARSSVPVNAELFFGGTMLAMDPPDHTRLRGLVAKAFTGRRVEKLRPRVQEITDRLLDGVAARGEADLIEEFAVPLPIQVICELLGVPASDRPRFREWTAVLTVPALTAQARERRREAARAFNGYLVEVIAERRAHPEDDLISGLITARDGDAALTEAELLGGIALLLIAGHETTVNLIGNGVFALLRAPDQLRLLRERPELLPSAIEELLRYDGPVERASQRIALEDMEIAGTPIPKGAWVHVSLGAANRDPAVFEDPARLDVTRAPKRHVAFGHGLHFCLGAPLARLEGQIAIGSLLRRFPDLALALPATEYRHHRTGSIVRGLVSLPVRV